MYLLSTGSVKALYRSQSPYTILSEFNLNTPFPVVEALGIVNDVTKSSEVLLMKSLLDQVNFCRVDHARITLQNSVNTINTPFS